MAQKVSADMIPHITKMSPRTDYNWEKYADGEWWQLRQGDDYTAQTVSVRQSLARWAKANDFNVQAAALKEGDGFVFRLSA